MSHSDPARGPSLQSQRIPELPRKPIVPKPCQIQTAEIPVTKKPAGRLNLLSVFAFAALLLALLVPPWEITAARQGTALITRPAGHAFILSPPEPPNRRIDTGMRISRMPYASQIAVPLVILMALHAPDMIRRRP